MINDFLELNHAKKYEQNIKNELRNIFVTKKIMDSDHNFFILFFVFSFQLSYSKQ